MANPVQNLAGVGRGLSRAFDNSRRRDQEDLKVDEYKKDVAFKEEERALARGQMAEAAQNRSFLQELQQVGVQPGDEVLDPEERTLKQLERQRAFALEKGKVEVAEKLSGAYEGIRQKRIERDTTEALRAYQSSGDLNDLTRPFANVNDGRKNFRFDGDDAKGYILNFEMANGEKRQVPIKNRQAAEEAVMDYVNPLGRMQREIAFRDYERRQGVLKDDRLDVIDANMRKRLAEIEAGVSAKVEAKGATPGRAGSGGNRAGADKDGGGDYGIDGQSLKRLYDAVSVVVPDEGLVVPGPTGEPLKTIPKADAVSRVSTIAGGLARANAELNLPPQTMADAARGIAIMEQGGTTSLVVPEGPQLNRQTGAIEGGVRTADGTILRYPTPNANKPPADPKQRAAWEAGLIAQEQDWSKEMVADGTAARLGAALNTQEKADDFMRGMRDPSGRAQLEQAWGMPASEIMRRVQVLHSHNRLLSESEQDGKLVAFAPRLDADQNFAKHRQATQAALKRMKAGPSAAQPADEDGGAARRESLKAAGVTVPPIERGLTALGDVARKLKTGFGAAIDDTRIRTADQIVTEWKSGEITESRAQQLASLAQSVPAIRERLQKELSPEKLRFLGL